jgi:acetyltransferase-like isoleucine patch superfamily enzyme
MDLLLERIQELHRCLDQEKRQKFNRSLPLNELLADRWQRAASLGFAEGSSIYDNSLVFGEVKVGPHTWIGPWTILDGSNGLAIGSYCSISSGVQIYSHDSVLWSLSGGKIPLSQGATSIGDNCYIGPNSIISAGVSIGPGCLIGAGSLVSHSLPAGVMAAGSPARILYKIYIDEGQRLVKQPWAP